MRALPMLLCLGAVVAASVMVHADGRVGRSYGDDPVVYVPRSDGVVVSVYRTASTACQPDRWSGRGYRGQRGQRFGYGRRFDSHRPSWETSQFQSMSTYCPTGAYELAPPRSDWQWGIRRTVPRVVDPVFGSPYRSAWDQPGSGYYQNVPYGPFAARRESAPTTAFRSADRCRPRGGTGPVVRILIDGQWVPYEPARW